MPTAFVSVDTRGKSYVPDAMIACHSYLNGTPTITGTPSSGQVLNSTEGEEPLVLKVTGSTSAWLMTRSSSGTHLRTVTIGANTVSAGSRTTMSASTFTGGSQVHSSGKILMTSFPGAATDAGKISCADLSSGACGSAVSFFDFGANVNQIWNPYMVVLSSSLALLLPNGRWFGGALYGGRAGGRSMFTLSLSGTTITSVNPTPADSGGFGITLFDTDTNWSADETDVVAAYRIDSTRAFVFYFAATTELRARVVTVSGPGSMSLGAELVVCATAVNVSSHETVISTPYQDHHYHYGGIDGLPSVNLDGSFSFCTAATVAGLETFYRFTVSVSGTTCTLATTERIDCPTSWGPYLMVETAVGKYVGYFSTKENGGPFTFPTSWNIYRPWGESRAVGGFGEFDMGTAPLTNRAFPRTQWSRDTVHMSRSMVEAHTRPAVAPFTLASGGDVRIPYSPPGGTYSLDKASYCDKFTRLAAVTGRTDTALQVGFSPSKVGATAAHDIHVALMRTQKRVRPAGTVELRAYEVVPWQAKTMTDYAIFGGTSAKMPTPPYTVVSSQARAQFNPDWIEAYNALPKFFGSNDYNGWRDLAACVPNTIQFKGFLAGENMFTATPTYVQTPYSKDALYINLWNSFDRFPARPGDLVAATTWTGSFAKQYGLRFYDKDGVIIGGSRDNVCVAPALTCSVSYYFSPGDPDTFADNAVFDVTITPQTADIFTGAVSTSKTRLIYAGPRAAGSGQLITVADPGEPSTALVTHAVPAGEYVVGVHSERFTNFCWWLTVSATELRWYRTAEGSGQPILRFSVAIGSALHTSIGGVPFSWFGWTSPTDAAKGYMFFNKSSTDSTTYYIYPGSATAINSGFDGQPHFGPGICLLKQVSLSGVTVVGLTTSTFGSGQFIVNQASYAPYLFNRAGFANSSLVSQAGAGFNSLIDHPAVVATAHRSVGTTRTDSDTGTDGYYTYWVGPSSHLGVWNYEAKAHFFWNKSNTAYETAIMSIVGDLKGFSYPVSVKKRSELRQFHARDLIRNDGPDAPTKTIRQGPHGGYQ